MESKPITVANNTTPLIIQIRQSINQSYRPPQSLFFSHLLYMTICPLNPFLAATHPASLSAVSVVPTHSVKYALHPSSVPAASADPCAEAVLAAALPKRDVA
jgi:hypothetical protein